jgi:hypothetical protein
MTLGKWPVLTLRAVQMKAIAELAHILYGYDPVVRTNTLRAAIVQAVEGKRVEVAAFFRQAALDEQVSAALRSANPDAVLSGRARRAGANRDAEQGSRREAGR